MQGLEVYVQEARQLEEYIHSEATSDPNRKRLEQYVQQYNSLVDYIRQFPYLIDPFYRFAPVDQWPQGIKPTKPISPLIKKIYRITPKILDLIFTDYKLLPQYKKECGYCDAGKFDVFEFPISPGMLALQVCENEDCFDKAFAYAEKLKKITPRLSLPLH